MPINILYMSNNHCIGWVIILKEFVPKVPKWLIAVQEIRAEEWFKTKGKKVHDIWWATETDINQLTSPLIEAT